MSSTPLDHHGDSPHSPVWERRRSADARLPRDVRNIASVGSQVVAFRAPQTGRQTMTSQASEIPEPLAILIQEFGKDLTGDGMFVGWHEPDREPTFLFASGQCEGGSAAEQDLILAASAAAADPTYQVRWDEGIDREHEPTFLTTRIPGADGVITVTALFRRAGRATRQKARDTAIRHFPILTAFFRLWMQRSEAAASVRGLTAALNSSNVGTMLVDAHGRLLFTNPAADSILADNQGLRRVGGYLRGAVLADTLRLHASIEHVATGVIQTNSVTPVLAIRRPNGSALLVAVIGVDQPALDPTGAAAVIRVFDPDQNLEPLLVPVCRLYGLSPVESRLACQLGAGKSLADAAKQMHVQEQTARTYLKQIFLKTATNRQAELVSLMLKSVVTTAPGAATRLV